MSRSSFQFRLALLKPLALKGCRQPKGEKPCLPIRTNSHRACGCCPVYVLLCMCLLSCTTRVMCTSAYKARCFKSRTMPICCNVQEQTMPSLMLCMCWYHCIIGHGLRIKDHANGGL